VIFTIEGGGTGASADIRQGQAACADAKTRALPMLLERQIGL